jgi:hypothetical protein
MINDATIIIIGEFHDVPEFGETIIKNIADEIGGYTNMQIFNEESTLNKINGQPAIPLEPALVQNIDAKNINIHTTLIQQNIPSQITDLYIFRDQVIKKMENPLLYSKEELENRYKEIVYGILPGDVREGFIRLVTPFLQDNTSEDNLFDMLDFCDERISQVISELAISEKERGSLNDLKDEDPTEFIMKIAAMRDEIMVSTFLQNREKPKLSVLIVGEDHIDNLVRVLRPKVADDIIRELKYSEMLESQKAGKKKRKVKSVKKRRSSRRRATKKRRKN